MGASQDVEPRGNDPVIATCLVVLVLFAWTIVGIPAGMKWGRLFHWTGEALLVLGVLLAAKGISDVRRGWTQQLGIWGSAVKRTRRVGEKGAELFWLYKNRFIEKLPRLARLLRLRLHLTAKFSSDGGIALDAASVHGSARPGRVRITGGPADLRFEQPEKRMAALEDDYDAFRAQYDKDFRTRQAEIEREMTERTAGENQLNERLQEKLSDAVGGGLHLQTWGVVCLPVGTILTAIWP